MTEEKSGRFVRSSFFQRFLFVDRVVVPLALFVIAYAGSFVVLSRALRWFVYPHAIAFASAALATAAMIALWERGAWNVGLLASPARIAAELLAGALFAAAVILPVDWVIVGTTAVDRFAGNGFPWPEIVVLFIPAVLHEELLFRGYAFQKLRAWNRHAALWGFALLFALVHARNTAVTGLALLNIFIAGLMLGLAYERYGRLWFPIGIHLAWNVLSGPVLGHEVSGYVLPQTVFRTTGEGSDWLTGGDFGMEGSILMTVTELAGVAWLSVERRRGANAPGDSQTPG